MDRDGIKTAQILPAQQPIVGILTATDVTLQWQPDGSTEPIGVAVPALADKAIASLVLEWPAFLPMHRRWLATQRDVSERELSPLPSALWALVFEYAADHLPYLVITHSCMNLPLDTIIRFAPCTDGIGAGEWCRAVFPLGCCLSTRINAGEPTPTTVRFCLSPSAAVMADATTVERRGMGERIALRARLLAYSLQGGGIDGNALLMHFGKPWGRSIHPNTMELIPISESPDSITWAIRVDPPLSLVSTNWNDPWAYRIAP